MKQKFYDSIIFKLIVSVVIIFIVMLLVVMYLVNRKQSMVIDAVMEEFQTNLPFRDHSVVLFVDSSKLQFTSDFKIYLFFIITCVIIVGSFVFALIIRKILAPLKNLQEKISDVDIDKPESFENLALVDSTSTEIVELSQSFDKMLRKIYADYKRQKDFSSNVAHELRTPIAVMKSQLDVYKQKIHTEDSMKMVRVLEHNVDKLNGLVDAILSLRKKSQLKLSKFSLESLVDEIILDLEDKASDKKVSLAYENLDLDIISDDSLMQRLLYNIIDNAIKYNKEGGSVKVSGEKSGDEIRILVKDTGIGISDSDKARIFDLFYQVDNSRGSEGYGIGLSLSKTIADMLRADIDIKENEPCGSIFIIKIPKSLS